MAEPTAEERLKIWAFRRALQALRQISPADLEWLSARLPSLGRATVVADAAAAVDGSAVPSQRTPFEAVIAFLQAATVHVTGRNMDALSGPALLIFGVLVGQRECLAFRDAHRRFEAAQRDAAAQPAAEADSAVEVVECSTAAAPVAPKLPSKPKLLLALAAMQLVEEPPGERKRVAPTDLDAEMLAEQAARQSRPKQQSAAAANTNNATAQPAKKAQPEKPAKATAKKPAAKATASAATATTAVAADAAEDSGDELVVAGGSSGVAVATRTSRGPAPTRAAPEAPVTADVASLAPKVARMVQLLTVTTPSVLVDKLRAQGIQASLADVNAAVQRLAQQELVVVEHGIIYPLC